MDLLAGDQDDSGGFDGLGVFFAFGRREQGQFAKDLARIDERQDGLLAIAGKAADFGPARRQQQDRIGFVRGQVDWAFARESAGLTR